MCVIHAESQTKSHTQDVTGNAGIALHKRTVGLRVPQCGLTVCSVLKTISGSRERHATLSIVQSLSLHTPHVHSVNRVQNTRETETPAHACALQKNKDNRNNARCKHYIDGHTSHIVSIPAVPLCRVCTIVPTPWQVCVCIVLRARFFLRPPLSGRSYW